MLDEQTAGEVGGGVAVERVPGDRDNVGGLRTNGAAGIAGDIAHELGGLDIQRATAADNGSADAFREVADEP